MCRLSTGPRTSRAGSRRSRVSTVRPSGRGRRGGRGGRLVPPLFLVALVVDYDSGSLAVLVLLVTMYLALCSLLALSGPRCSASRPVWSRKTAAVVQAQDARLHDRHGPQDSFGGSQVQFLDKVFYMLVVVLRVVSWFRQCSTLFGGSAVAVHHGRRHSLLIRRGRSPWSWLFR